ncbi:glutathione-dependent formaldehyde-activating [Xylariaceae sp. FL0804]|nr:glutathione-dependent formaldehyde-activating [Xylariaceae sp. FL0804]
MEASCQCGAVQFLTPLPKPLALYICHCSECRRQSSSAFGASAIFPRFELPKADLLSCYSYFCRNCGTRLIHSAPGKKVVSITGGCIAGLDWQNAIHIFTRSAMVPIPEASETYPGDLPAAAAAASSSSPSDSEYGGSQDSLREGRDRHSFLMDSGGFHGAGLTG